MLKSVPIIILAIALGVAAWLLPLRGEQATAQSGPLHILVVEYDIVPAEIEKYLTAIKELGAAAVKEPGCRQLSIAVSQKDPNHVLLFEAWDNAAAHAAHVATEGHDAIGSLHADLAALDLGIAVDLRLYVGRDLCVGTL